MGDSSHCCRVPGTVIPTWRKRLLCLSQPLVCMAGLVSEESAAAAAAAAAAVAVSSLKLRPFVHFIS